MRRLLAALGVASILLTGCIHAELEQVQPGPDDADPAAAERTRVGERVTTREGNEVAVRRVAGPGAVPGSDLELLEAEVEICAAGALPVAGTSPTYFRALVPEGYRRPVAPSKQPTLPAERLEAGDCVRGWIGFPVREAEYVEAIVLLASSTVEWVLP